jgi:MFS family permease
MLDPIVQSSPPSPLHVEIDRPSFTWRLFAPYRVLDRRIFLLALTRCINTMGFSLVMPFMAMYLVKERGVLARTSGLVYLVAGVAAAASQGFAGELADRVGRRRVMALALALRAVNMVILGVAVTEHASIHVLGLLIVTNGMLRSMFEPAAGAAVTDLAPEEHRVAAFGLQRIGINFGWSLGPMLGGALASIGYGHLFFFSAPALVAAAAVAARIDDRPRARLPSRAERPGPRALIEALRGNRPFFVCLVLVFFGSMLTTQLFATLSTYLGAELGWKESRIGLVYTVNGVLVVLFQVPAVALIRRGGARVALVAGPTMYTLAYLVLGLSPSFWWIAACVAFLTFGEVVFSPALSDMAVFLGDPARHGRSFGLFGLMQTLGISLGPLLGGVIFDALRHHHAAMWAVLAVLMSFVALGYRAFSARYAPRVT